MIKELSHKGIIKSLVDRLHENKDYLIVGSEQEYNFFVNNKRVFGEVDVYAVKATPRHSYVLVFEVKSSDSFRNRRKALEQLAKDDEYFKKIIGDKVYKFYVTLNKIEWITGG